MGQAFGAFFLLYIIIVGWQGRALDFTNQAAEDAKGFVPFLFAVATLLMLQNSRAKPIVGPFITLAVITTILTRFNYVEQDLKSTYDELINPTKSGYGLGNLEPLTIEIIGAGKG